MPKDVLIGIDAGTSVIKSVAFDLSGKQIAVASTPNIYTTRSDGAAFQSLRKTWDDCATTLRMLGEKVPNLAQRTVAVAVTGQGDGTWLVGEDNEPVTDGWIWLDARSTPAVDRLSTLETDRARFEATGTGLNCCQMGSQLSHMLATTPEYLDKAEVALHPKDWLYLKLTDIRATDPSEACFTFGNFRTRDYDETVIDALDLSSYRHLLPEIIDGTQTHHVLTASTARETGLLPGTPVVLGFVDVVCTGLGSGVFTGQEDVGCSILGSTGMHMRAKLSNDVILGKEATGYVMVLPIPDMVLQIQSNMAATLNIDWLLKLASDLISNFGNEIDHSTLVKSIDGWLEESQPASLMYHPYISEAGERGPFINPFARASFQGLNSSHRFPDLLRAVIEGLGLASRDCYSVMGQLPKEIRLTGGAAKSIALRHIISSVLNSPVRYSDREEAGAAGAAMMAAVSIGIYDDMHSCIKEWVSPLLGNIEFPDSTLSATYDKLFNAYRAHRTSSEPIWQELAKL
ncbi:FGGY-family carbohydrate kinase [Lentilitoribacter sp. EG35]|uniref:FGGY-family carbohydrate kinase n=1 Tax=Lentilitoribacter sp. EG35 TaxID=3234192 RepID=UPI0034614623